MILSGRSIWHSYSKVLTDFGYFEINVQKLMPFSELEGEG